MVLSGLLIHDTAVAADVYGLTAVTLLGPHDFDSAVSVLMVVPVDQLGDPLTDLVSVGNWLAAKPGRYFTVLNSDSKYGSSLDSRGF